MSKKEKIILILAIIFFAYALIAILVNLQKNFNYQNTNIPRAGMNSPEMPNGAQRPNGFMAEENVEKETKPEDIDSGKSVSEEKINLNEHTSNITIAKAGSYTLTGEFEHSVLVNADGEVILNLENTTITNNITAAIANISNNSLVINLLENTTNTLTDGGSSEYDSCIYSMGDLTINGKGTLNIYGKQEEGEGIATETKNITINGGNIKIESEDDGLNAGGDGGTITINDGTVYIKASGDGIDSNKNIVINGGYVYSIGSALGGDAGMDADLGITINAGTVIALGSDMLEKPLSNSKQGALSFNLNTSIESGSTISLKNDTKDILSFVADEKFRTLIISHKDLTSGKYYLYNEEEKISEIENN